ncbi:dTMP kinase [Listeria monocytogenes]|nr:dTMP kinase [Listeria monocytogenes]MBC1253621.1 dTMP kinase [Listeria welshimeri]
MGGYITFEGIDGCGKSTQARMLLNYLREKNLNSISIYEPGATSLGIDIRNKLLESQNRNFSELAEVFLFLLDRSQTYQEIIKNKLYNNYFVISDRGIDSTLAYQNPKYEELISLGNYYALDESVPDLTILLDIPVSIAQERMARERDYYDMLCSEKKENIRKRYLEIAKQNAERIVVLNGLHDEASISNKVKNIVERRFLNV